MAARRHPTCSEVSTWVVEPRGFEPLASCMPSQSYQQTGPYRTSPDTTSPQVGGDAKGLAVLSCVDSQGPVADTLLTTDRMQNTGLTCAAGAR
jgi:hypothetical protein